MFQISPRPFIGIGVRTVLLRLAWC